MNIFNQAETSKVLAMQETVRNLIDSHKWDEAKLIQIDLDHYVQLLAMDKMRNYTKQNPCTI